MVHEMESAGVGEISSQGILISLLFKCKSALYFASCPRGTHLFRKFEHEFKHQNVTVHTHTCTIIVSLRLP